MRTRNPGLASGVWEKEFLAFLPSAGTAAGEQEDECLAALKAALRERGLGPGSVVKLTFFVRAAAAAELSRRRRTAAAALRAALPRCRATLGVVAQAPEQDRVAAVEAVILRRPSRSLEIVPKAWRGVPYVVLCAPGGREVIAGGIMGAGSGDPVSRTAAAFVKASGILAREGLSFADVIRQWNFIEDITGHSWIGPRSRQNYQIFNDIRAEAYDRDGLREGFPAATGIGAAAGGFVLELIAAAGTAAEESRPVSNPLQSDAHRYSPGVLVGPPGERRGRRRTPKFERARVVVSGGAGTCYVSGTAAIVGETVVCRGDADGQTRATIRNIERLVAPANLRRSGFPAVRVGPKFSYVRTYVKKGADIRGVARIVRGSFPDAAALFVEADICREDLLVEIEGAVDVVTD